MQVILLSLHKTCTSTAPSHGQRELPHRMSPLALHEPFPQPSLRGREGGREGGRKGGMRERRGEGDVRRWREEEIRE